MISKVWIKESLTSAVVVIGLGLGVYFGIGFLAQWIAGKIPDQWEKNYLSRLGDSLVPRGVSAKEPEMKALLQKLLRRNEPTRRLLKYHIFVAPEAEANAFALPGGGIVVTEGLLEMLKTEIGLAFVVGHELGHHQNRHVLRHMGRSLIIGGLASLILGDPGFIGGLLLTLINNSYSHAQEYEADLYGYQLVRELYGPSPKIVEFFDKIEKVGEGNLEGIDLKLLSTHPYTPDRRKKLLDLNARDQ